MADSRKKIGKPGNIRISAKQPYEINYWSRKLRVTKPELKDAVKEAGPMVKNVMKELRKK